jgi:hypothetical protein
VTRREESPPHAHYLLGAVLGAVGGFLAWKLFQNSSAAGGSSAVPQTGQNWPTSPTAPGVVQVPLTNPGPLMEGALYLAKVVVPSPLSWLASASKVLSYAEKYGFTNVTVSQTAPSYFQDTAVASSGATYWVVGTYAQPSKQMTFPTAVTIEAWYVDWATNPVVPNTLSSGAMT